MVGNWKMNGVSASIADAQAIFAAAGDHAGVDVALCPPFTLIGAMVAAAPGAAIGGQDCHSAASGAFTGSVAAPMLVDAGATLVIVGHSERREGCGESDADVRAKAEAGLAAGLSASTTGDLTQSSYAATSTAAAAKAAFTARQGDLIGPIQTGLGWSVARVEAVTARPARSLADASADIRTELAKNKANEAIVDYYNAIQDAVNSGASIDEIAADRKLTLATTPALLPSGRVPGQPAYTLPPELAPLVSQAFQGSSEGEGQLATLVENQKFAVYAVKSIVAAAPPPFAQIRADLLSDWRFSQGQKVARDKARAIVKAVEGGQTLAAAVSAAGPNIGDVQTIGGRRGELGQNGQPVPPELALLFSMAKNSVKTLEIPGNRGWMVIALADVQRPDPKSIEPARVAAIAQPLAPAFGNELIEQLAGEAKRRVGVTINKELVEQLRQELTGTAPVAE